jgi:CBS domain-containing protein
VGKDIAGLVAKDVMRTRLVTLDPTTDVFEGIKTLVKNKISGAPVVDKTGRLLGVFSEKCSMQVVIDAAYEGLPTNKISAFMDLDPQTVNEDTGLLTIANVFLITPRRRLPVLRDGILVGQISRRDVISAASKQSEIKSPHSKTLLYLSAIREMDEAPV